MLMPMLRNTASRIDSRLPISSSGPKHTPALESNASVKRRVVEPGSRINTVCPANAPSDT
ncbi:hypothetical protein D3C76_1811750 [compost metagenome]